MSNRKVHFEENVTLRQKTSKRNVNKPPVRKSNGAASCSPSTVDLFDPLGVYAKQEAEIAVLETEVTENGTPAYPDIRELFNKLKPTTADLTRTYTEEELKEICLRVKCKVRMELFNPVEDSARRLRREGRLQARSERYVNKILTKAVMRYKDTALYSQEEIDMHRQFQWRERRRQNNLNLVVWNTERQFAQNKKRKHQLSQLLVDSTNTEISDDASLLADTIQSLHDSSDVTNNSSINEMQMSPILQQENANENETGGQKQTSLSMVNSQNAMENSENQNVENSDNSEEYDEIEFLDMIESEYVDENGNATSSQSQTNEQKEDKSKSSGPRIVSTQELGDMLAYTSRTQEEACDITINSQASQGLLREIVQLNTESMTIEEDYIDESEEQIHANENAVQQSEPLVYDYFNSQIPLTSTQSQHGNTQPQ